MSTTNAHLERDDPRVPRLRLLLSLMQELQPDPIPVLDEARAQYCREKRGYATESNHPQHRITPVAAR